MRWGATLEAEFMGSTIITKVIVAVAVTLVVDLTERALDQLGVSKDTAKLPREIIKAVAAMVSGVLMESVLNNDRAEIADSSA